MKNELDINKNPERFSAFERAIHAHNLICKEMKFDKWELDLPVTNETKFMCTGVYGGTGYVGAFLEGLMVATAFCSGSISGGKVREMCKVANEHLDLHMIVNFMSSTMECQTLWEQNPSLDIDNSMTSPLNELARLRHELNLAHLLIVDLYHSAHRKGWEPGESVEELCDRTHDYLCNEGLDPYANGGPERIAQLRQATKGEL